MDIANLTGRQGKNLTVSSVKRIQGRAKLMLSNGEEVLMPRSMLKERPYKSGMPFDKESFDAFLRERAFSFAMEKAVALLASRSRTEKEIVDALNKNAYPETAVARVMQRLCEAGYINDKDFAQQWADSRTSKGMGAQRIRTELRRKGVGSDEIDEVIENLDEDDVMAGAFNAAKKAARGKDLSFPGDRQKVMAALVRRGYGYATAREAISRLKDES